MFPPLNGDESDHGPSWWTKKKEQGEPLTLQIPPTLDAGLQPSNDPLLVAETPSPSL